MVGSPASGVILYLYAKSIKTRGPKFTMRVSEVFCLLLLGLILGISGHVKGLLFQVSVVVFYAFREIYVSLISTQQWAFIASILDSSTSSYMVSFSGIVGISSAVGGCMVEFLVTKWGVKGLLATAFISSVLCFICAELAYFISHGAENDEQVSHDKSTNDSTSKLKLSVWRESLDLFKKHRTLQILFIEAIFHQLVGNMLNLMFHDALRLNILDDDHRALMVIYSLIHFCIKYNF
jgi:phosphate/sulfate permease